MADPPRPQARDAMAQCRSAGVAVKMITGDHADTATAIARELDIDGQVVTGTELDRMTEEQLAARIDDIGVFARVAPEHKVGIVRALRWGAPARTWPRRPPTWSSPTTTSPPSCGRSARGGRSTTTSSSSSASSSPPTSAPS
ncbi:hypothetical protein [Streptomyces sp. UG1]|uniref:hypothetical protein n=1 Tax=Streptomyces sp. UG1 TaxID=3417652 RepID=UPI003CEDF2D6